MAFIDGAKWNIHENAPPSFSFHRLFAVRLEEGGPEYGQVIERDLLESFLGLPLRARVKERGVDVGTDGRNDGEVRDALRLGHFRGVEHVGLVNLDKLFVRLARIARSSQAAKDDAVILKLLAVLFDVLILH